ncbi:MAG: MgtC/SapB family protein [Calditrichaeota bacterium]|nr:MAG: MgtC/SapB family protein [Calditrichota bacterium]
MQPAVLNILKVVVAALCGGLIGLERERDQKPAGVRTQMLVAIGACLFMIVSTAIGNNYLVDPSRIAAQVVTGIGFLGAGAIIRERGSVMGMTTAASIWVVAAIGLTIGAGLFIEGVFITLLTYIILGWLNRWLKP